MHNGQRQLFRVRNLSMQLEWKIWPQGSSRTVDICGTKSSRQIAQVVWEWLNRCVFCGGVRSLLSDLDAVAGSGRFGEEGSGVDDSFSGDSGGLSE